LPALTHCPECGAALVETLPPIEETGPRYQEFEEAILCILQGEIHAKLLCDTLGTQGIRTRVAMGAPYDSFYDTLFPPPIGSPAHLSFRIFVRREDLRRALSVYRDFELPANGVTGAD
jgi:hypothetical protein